MTSITFFFFLVPVLAILLLAINFIFATHTPYEEKNSAFECGFHSFLGQNRMQFNISFYIFGLLFLLFDLEILLIYPYPISAYFNSFYGLSIMLIFFLVLTLGFAFELGKNALKIDSRQYTNKKIIYKIKFSDKLITNNLEELLKLILLMYSAILIMNINIYVFILILFIYILLECKLGDTILDILEYIIIIYNNSSSALQFTSTIYRHSYAYKTQIYYVIITLLYISYYILSCNLHPDLLDPGDPGNPGDLTLQDRFHNGMETKSFPANSTADVRNMNEGTYRVSGGHIEVGRWGILANAQTRITQLMPDDPHNQAVGGYNVFGGNQPFAGNFAKVLYEAKQAGLGDIGPRILSEKEHSYLNEFMANHNMVRAARPHATYRLINALWAVD